MTLPMSKLKCGGCLDNDATCWFHAGHSVYFVKDGESYDDPEQVLYLCDDCCGHGGEEPCCPLQAEAEAYEEEAK